MADTFCDNLMDYAPIPMFAGSTGVVSVVLGLIYIVMGFTTVYFIKYNEWKARSGNNKAVGSVIFPVFVYVLWGNAFINFYVGMVAMNYSFRPFASNSVLKAFLFSVMYALQHMVIEGVAFLLMQKGLGFYAARKAFVRAVVWGAVTFLVYFVSFRGNSEVLGFIAQLLWGLALVVFYLLLWITPERRLFRRSAAIDYAKYWFIFRSIAVLSTIFYFAPPTEGVGNCVYIFGKLNLMISKQIIS